eukprot:3969463-Amphidinium_carterae.1
MVLRAFQSSLRLSLLHIVVSFRNRTTTQLRIPHAARGVADANGGELMAMEKLIGFNKMLHRAGGIPAFGRILCVANNDPYRQWRSG